MRRVTTGVGDAGQDGAVVADARLNRVFVLNQGDGSVSILDARSGAVLHTAPVGQSPGALALDDRTDRLFVVNRATDSNGVLPIERGSVSVLDARNGALLRTVAVGWDPIDVAVDEQRGDVLVVNRNTGNTAFLRGRGSVSVLDARSGVVRRTITVGAAPVSVAVDEPTGHAFVPCEGGTIPAPDTTWGWLPSWLRRRLPFLPPPGPRTRTLPASVTVLDPAR